MKKTKVQKKDKIIGTEWGVIVHVVFDPLLVGVIVLAIYGAWYGLAKAFYIFQDFIELKIYPVLSSSWPFLVATWLFVILSVILITLKVKNNKKKENASKKRDSASEHAELQ